MVYPELTNISAAVLPDMFLFANNVSFGYAGAVFLGIIVFVTIIGLSGFGVGIEKTKALAAGMILASLLALPLYVSQIINDFVLFTTLILTVLAIFYMYYTKEDV